MELTQLGNTAVQLNKTNPKPAPDSQSDVILVLAGHMDRVKYLNEEQLQFALDLAILTEQNVCLALQDEIDYRQN